MSGRLSPCQPDCLGTLRRDHDQRRSQLMSWSWRWRTKAHSSTHGPARFWRVLGVETSSSSINIAPVLSTSVLFTAMASTERHEKEMVQKAKADAAKGGQSPLTSLRNKCLSRGASGIKGLSRWVSYGQVEKSSLPLHVLKHGKRCFMMSRAQAKHSGFEKPGAYCFAHR